jgi:membrane protein YdbS with pleckstrin-like domain
MASDAPQPAVDGDPFDAGEVTWRPVSPKLATVRRIGAAAPWAVLAIAAGVVGSLIGSIWIGAVVALAAAGYVWAWWLIGRQVRAWAYAERPEELLIRSGVMWRTIVVVPYGRLQYVDVDAGPLLRAYGLASVQLHTASAGSDARIPGLAAAEAARLRDRLTERGQAQLAGL